jgi:hypothetical protein
MWFYRRKIVGGFSRLSREYPGSLVFPVLVHESERDALLSAGSPRRGLRLPAYFTLVLVGSSLSVWAGARPKLVARWECVSAREVAVQAIARSMPAVEATVLAARSASRVTFTFVPLSPDVMLIPKGLGDDGLQRIVKSVKAQPG